LVDGACLKREFLRVPSDRGPWRHAVGAVHSGDPKWHLVFQGGSFAAVMDAAQFVELRDGLGTQAFADYGVHFAAQEGRQGHDHLACQDLARTVGGVSPAPWASAFAVTSPWVIVAASRRATASPA